MALDFADAIGPVGVGSVRAAARLDIGGNRQRALAFGVEIDVEHAGRTQKLELARIALLQVNARFAETLVGAGADPVPVGG